MKISAFDSNEVDCKGTWLAISKDLELLIAPANNKEYDKVLEQLQAPYTDMIRRGTLPREIAEEIGQKAFSKAILLGWRDRQDHKKSGLTEDDGKQFPWNEENGLLMLKKEWFARYVMDLSEAQAKKVMMFHEEGAKNL